jgi:excisionase family DNA binding protein
VAEEVRYYTVEEAARVLRLTPQRVLEMINSGELEGVPSVGGAGWRIPIHGDIDAPPPATSVPAETPASHSEVTEMPEEPDEPELPPDETPEVAEAPRQSIEAPPGVGAASIRESPAEATSESGWVTTQQAARALGISARTVRWHIERGNIDAKPEGEGVERTWRVSVDSLQAFRDARQRQQQSPRDYRADMNAPDIAAADPGSAIRELADRLVEEARRAEAARVRLELSERAQSTLEAELADERRRREEAERTAEDLRRELDEWRRLEESAETTAHEIHERREEERSHEDTPPEPSESQPSPDPSHTPTDAAGETQEATRDFETRGSGTARGSWWSRLFGG